MRPIPTKIASIAAAAAIMVTPTMAAASTLSSVPAPNNWVTFSQLNPAGAAALAGSSVAAAHPAVAMTGSAAAVQGADDGGYHNGIPLPVIAVWLAVIGAAIYIALIEKHHHHRVFLTSPD
jgi:hypothetical protein